MRAQEVEDASEPRASRATDPYFVGALARGIEVLRCLGASPRSLSLAEVADRLGWRRNVPFRYLHTLEQLGYVHRDAETRRYSLTLATLEFGFAALGRLDWPELAQPYLDRLRDDSGASAHLGILDGDDVVYVARAASRAMLASNIHVGSRLPAHATAIGKVLLAGLPDTERKQFLTRAELRRFTAHTLDADALVSELERVREQGFAVSNEEFELGVRSVAAPVRDRSGAVVAAINLSGPPTVLGDAELRGRTKLAVIETAEALSGAWALRGSSG